MSVTVTPPVSVPVAGMWTVMCSGVSVAPSESGAPAPVVGRHPRTGRRRAPAPRTRCRRAAARAASACRCASSRYCTSDASVAAERRHSAQRVLLPPGRLVGLPEPGQRAGDAELQLRVRIESRGAPIARERLVVVAARGEHRRLRLGDASRRYASPSPLQPTAERGNSRCRARNVGSADAGFSVCDWFWPSSHSGVGSPGHACRARAASRATSDAPRRRCPPRRAPGG